MKETLRILHIEDSLLDALLVENALKSGDIKFEKRVVNNKADYISALEDFSPDIILSDHNLASFNSLEAIEILKERNIRVPFILITAIMSEEFAVEVMKRGAYDYILKDRMQRLPGAVYNANEKLKKEREHRAFLDKLVESEMLLKKAEKQAKVGSWRADLQTERITWSDESYRIYGYEPNEVIPSFELVLKHIYPADLDAARNIIEEAVANKRELKTDFRIIDNKGKLKYIHAELMVERNQEGVAILLHGFNQDISEIRVKEAELVASEHRYRTIVETAQEGVWMIDENNKTIFVNRRMCEILGYTTEEMMGKDIFYFMDEEGKAIATESIKRRREGIKESLDMKYVTSSGNYVWANISANPVFNEEGKYLGAVAMVMDITDRKIANDKLMQSEIRIRKFVQHQSNAQEEERRRIAREIHDELGQQLVGIKIGLSSLLKHGKAGHSVEEKAEAMIRDVDTAIQSLRKIATELRPGILDTLGLIASIRWLIKEFGKKTGIPCSIEQNVREQKFDPDVSIVFFRICQEALTNIYKHAEATSVEVLMAEHDGEFVLCIKDNGKGISTDRLENPFSMGLLGMLERAHIINGDLHVMKGEPSGTIVRLAVKVNNK